ncbi:MAG: CopG family transcriptional regulator [Chloroflexi bacterium]|nr:CopG family transcriptional regulator [Chloroflexota bacterium]
MEMERVQVLLPHEEREALKHEAARLGLSMSEVVRRALRVVLPAGRGGGDASRTMVESAYLDDDFEVDPDTDPFLSLIGFIASEEGDLAINHDHYLYGAPKKQA